MQYKNREVPAASDRTSYENPGSNFNLAHASKLDYDFWKRLERLEKVMLAHLPLRHSPSENENEIGMEQSTARPLIYILQQKMHDCF